MVPVSVTGRLILPVVVEQRTSPSYTGGSALPRLQSNMSTSAVYEAVVVLTFTGILLTATVPPSSWNEKNTSLVLREPTELVRRTGDS